jgi:predicted acetyltransferase
MSESIDLPVTVLSPLQDGDLLLELAELKLHPVHKVSTYFFRMVQTISGEEIGSINLRTVSNPHISFYAGHIGFDVHPDHRGHRYASRALPLLMPAARELKIDPLWITCDPENTASRRSCELAGAAFIEIVDVPATCIIHQNGHPRKCRYRLTL